MQILLEHRKIENFFQHNLDNQNSYKRGKYRQH